MQGFRQPRLAHKPRLCRHPRAWLHFAGFALTNGLLKRVLLPLAQPALTLRLWRLQVELDVTVAHGRKAFIMLTSYR